MSGKSLLLRRLDAMVTYRIRWIAYFGMNNVKTEKNLHRYSPLHDLIHRKIYNYKRSNIWSSSRPKWPSAQSLAQNWPSAAFSSASGERSNSASWEYSSTFGPCHFWKTWPSRRQLRKGQWGNTLTRLTISTTRPRWTRGLLLAFTSCRWFSPFGSSWLTGGCRSVWKASYNLVIICFQSVTD